MGMAFMSALTEVMQVDVEVWRRAQLETFLEWMECFQDWAGRSLLLLLGVTHCLSVLDEPPAGVLRDRVMS